MHLTTETRLDEYLRSQGIREPAKSFAAIVSNVWHAFESQHFDSVHSEITESADRWYTCLSRISPALPGSLRVLDIGTGTGFASAQVLRVLGDRISALVCQDLSPDMLRKCVARVRSLTTRAHFVAGPPQCLLGDRERFDLVITSAMFHHVLDLRAFFQLVGHLVRPGGFYVAGHEPSQAFYATESLYRWTIRYRRWRRLRRALSPRTLLRRVRALQSVDGVEQRTNEALVRRGIIRAPLPPGVILQLVDIHIPPASPDTPFWGERGFNPHELCRTLLPDFQVTYLTTYPHVKDARARMGVLWRAIDSSLAKKYPDAGANFLMVARRDISRSHRPPACSH